jgi:hypothetical protein
MKIKSIINLNNGFDDMSQCHINIPDVLPVTVNYNHNNVIGFAKTTLRDYKNGIIELEIDGFEFGTSRVVKERDGNKIKFFELHSVSLIQTAMKPTRPDKQPGEANDDLA